MYNLVAFLNDDRVPQFLRTDIAVAVVKLDDVCR